MKHSLESELLARLVEQYRRNHGMTQPELGAMVGVSTQFINQLELAKAGFPRITLAKIVTVLDIPVKEIKNIYRIVAESNLNAILEAIKTEQLRAKAIKKTHGKRKSSAHGARLSS